MKGRIKKKLKKKNWPSFLFQSPQNIFWDICKQECSRRTLTEKTPAETCHTSYCSVWVVTGKRNGTIKKKKSGWESQFCTNFLKKLFWIAHIQCGLIFGCWSLCRVSMSRHVDDTYCEIVIFILVSLGLFHGFILKVKPESDHREEMSEGRRCAAKEPRVGFEARTAAARTQLLYSSTNWASGAPREILICLLSNKPLNSLTFLD